MTSFAKVLEKSLLPLFLAWSSVGLAALIWNINPAWVFNHTNPGFLQSFLTGCLRWGDLVFHILAAGNLLCAAARYTGWRRTWICFACTCVFSGIVETIGAGTGFPFGSYYYTDRMGPLIAGTLPWAIPLAWWNILASLQLLLRRVLPRWNRRNTALATAALATLVDWNMEPFAWGVKQYWIWTSGSVPVQNYIGWLGLSFILCRLTPVYNQYTPPPDIRPPLIPATLLLFFNVGLLVSQF